MSIAWPTVALLIALLPGFLFGVGMSLPEDFTRETRPRNLLGQLAAVVLVSLFVHAILFAVNRIGSPPLPVIKLDLVLTAFDPSSAGSGPFKELGQSLERYWLLIAVYVGFASVGGLGCGYFFGKAIIGDWRLWPPPRPDRLASWLESEPRFPASWVAWPLDRLTAGRDRRPFRRFARHGWVYDLRIRGRERVSYAYIMTHVQEQGRILMYRGILKQFGLEAAGSFSYLVLTKASRYYMRLTDPPTTTSRVAIGASRQPNDESPISSYLVVEGEDIANVVFDSFNLPGPTTAEEREQLERGVEAAVTHEELLRRITEQLTKARERLRQQHEEQPPGNQD